MATLTMHEWFNRLTFMRIEGYDVAVQIKCPQKYIRRDLTGHIWIGCTGDTINKSVIKTELFNFIGKT